MTDEKLEQAILDAFQDFVEADRLYSVGAEDQEEVEKAHKRYMKLVRMEERRKKR